MNGETPNSFVKIFLSFFFAWLLAALCSIDYAASLGLDFWTASLSDLRPTLGGSDSGSYIDYARFLQNHLGIEMKEWFLRIWPPAYPMFIAGASSILGEAHYLVKITLISVICWSGVYTLLYYRLPFLLNNASRFLALCSTLLLFDFRHWAVGGGVISTESLSSALLIAAFSLMLTTIVEQKERYLYAAIFLLGIGANMRVVYDVLFRLIFTGMLILVLSSLVLQIYHAWKTDQLRMLQSEVEFKKKWRAIRIFVFSLILLNLVVAPWKLYNYRLYDRYDLSTLSGADALDWAYHWEPAETLPGFVRAGNTACLIEPELCKKVAPRRPQIKPLLPALSAAVLFTKPFQWAAHRLKNVNWLWFGRPWTVEKYNSIEILIRVEAVLYVIFLIWGLLAMLGSIITTNSRSVRNRLLLLLSFSMLFIGAHVAIFTVAHFEHRYSLAIRLFCVFLPASVAVLISPNNLRSSQSLKNAGDTKKWLEGANIKLANYLS